MIDHLRKQEQIGKATFQFTFHSTITCKQCNNTSSKLKPTTLTHLLQLQIFRLSAGLVSSLFTVPSRSHYQKLYARVTYIWGNHKGQPDPSAMKGPRLERTASVMTVPPALGKFFVFKVDGRASLRGVQCPPTDRLRHPQRDGST